MQEYMKVLGRQVRDKVTGFKGVVSSVGFDLYGCVQVVVQPVVNDKGEKADGHWFDFNRIEVLDTTPVMTLPSFALEDVHGPADKPARD